MPVHAVGRDQEMAAAARVLDEVSRGLSVLLIEGEAGMGKSTLWRAAVADAERRGLCVLNATPTNSEARMSFTALSDLLAGVERQALDALPPPQRTAVEVALLRRESQGMVVDHRAVSAGFLSIVAGVAVSGPTIIAVDDVQWLDPDSARALEFALRRIGELPIGFLATSRLPRRPAWVSRVERAFPADRFHRVRLGPLSLEVIDAILRATLGAQFPRRTLLRIEETSGGNPLFALEIARALLEAGDEVRPGAPLPVPERLTDLLAQRIGSLPAPTRRALLVASALSAPTVQTVQAVVGPAATKALSRAEDAELIQVGEGRIRFSHPLLRAEVYASAPPSARRTLHRKLAEVTSGAEERARHQALATDGPNDVVAAILDRAAETARMRGASGVAVELLHEALRLGDPVDEHAIRCRTLNLAARLLESGDTRAARRTLHRAIASFPAGPQRAEALRLLAVEEARSDGPIEAHRRLRRALADAGQEGNLPVTIHLALSWVSSWVGNVASGADHARAALRLVGPSGDNATRAQAMAMVACADFLLGRPPRKGLLDEALRLEAPESDLPVEWRPSFLRGFILKFSDELDEARTAFAKVKRVLDERGDEASLPYLLHHLGDLECMAGNHEEARRYADECLERAGWLNQPLMRVAGLYVRSLVDARMGRLDDAQAGAEEGLEVAVRAGMPPAIHVCTEVLGFVELSRDDPAAAHGRLGPLVDLLREIGLGEPSLLRFLPDEVEALIIMGVLDQAEGILDGYEARGRAVNRRSVLAAAARCRGLLLAARGDEAGALASLDRAVELHQRLRMPFDMARTLLVKGRVHRRRKEKSLSNEHLVRATAIFERLGAAAWARKARAEQRRVGLRPRAPADLTGTELQVADLAARGLTNDQVAAAAFVSVKTVESALTRVYRKLGIRSRAELGARMTERRAGHREA